MSHRYLSMVVTLSLLLATQPAGADPCGMVPPIYTGPGQPITRIGDQMTYVAQRHLEPDATGEPVQHPMLDRFFSGFHDGHYHSDTHSN